MLKITKMMITFTHIADYNYMASEQYSLLCFEELLWITFNFFYKSNHSLYVPMEPEQDWLPSHFMLTISLKWHAIHNKYLTVYLAFSARNVCSYLQIGNAYSTSSTPSGLGFITVHQWKLFMEIIYFFWSLSSTSMRLCMASDQLQSTTWCTIHSTFPTHILLYSLDSWCTPSGSGHNAHRQRLLSTSCIYHWECILLVESHEQCSWDPSEGSCPSMST